MRKISNIYILCFCVALLLLVQYIQYGISQNEVSSLIRIPKTIQNTSPIYLNSGFKVESMKSVSAFEKSYSIASSLPGIRIIRINGEEIIKQYMTIEYLDTYLQNHSQFANAIREIPKSEFLGSQVNSTKESRLAIVFLSKVLAENDHFIEISSKKFNTWNTLLGPAKYRAEFRVVQDPLHMQSATYIDAMLEDHIIRIANKWQNNKTQTFESKCPVKYLAYNFNSERPLYALKTSEYHFIEMLCSHEQLAIDNGEQITVEIYTKNLEDGKRAFREALAKDGFKESDKLRVVYIHVPKTN